MLDDAEWDVMAQHPVIGEGILRRLPQLAPLAPIVRHEHEHWDGTGYPDGLAGTQIPIGSRIILACDAYVAMTAQRPYRAALDAGGRRRRAARPRRARSSTRRWSRRCSTCSATATTAGACGFGFGAWAARAGPAS